MGGSGEGGGRTLTREMARAPGAILPLSCLQIPGMNWAACSAGSLAQSRRARAHLVRNDKDERVRALDRLEQVRVRDDHVRNLDPRQVLDLRIISSPRYPRQGGTNVLMQLIELLRERSAIELSPHQLPSLRSRTNRAPVPQSTRSVHSAQTVPGA